MKIIVIKCEHQARSQDFVMEGANPGVAAGGHWGRPAVFTIFHQINAFLGIFKLKFLL